MTTPAPHRLLQLLVGIADRWVPPALHAVPATRMRARVLILFCAITLLTCPVFTVSYWIDGQPILSAVVLAALLVCALIPPLLRRTGSLALAGNLATTCYFVAQLTVVALAGGYDVGTLYWIAVTPVFGAFLGGALAGRRWLVPAVVAVIGMTWLGETGDLLPQIARAPSPPFEALGVIILAVLLSAVAAVYEAMSGRSLREAEDARARAEEVSRAKGEFLATMSHEIRTPLNGILGMTDVLLLGEIDEERRRRLQVVRDSGAGLLRAVNDVLDLVRLDTAGVELHLDAFDPGVLADDIARLYTPAAEARGLVLEVVRPPPLVVAGDREKIRQILSNLLSNAVKYTDRGRIRFVLETSPDETGAKSQLRFLVEDTGRGIDPARHEQVFEPYGGSQRRTADSSMSGEPSGTGLGLAISRRLAAAMGASLSLSSSMGQGSRFTLRITLPTAAQPPPPVAAAGATSRSPSRAGRVLVVEDNPVNREVARLMLQSRGLSVELVDEGGAALHALAGTSYDLVLMDCQMPGLDGFETTREIRRIEGAERRTPIVAMTAAALAGDRDRCLVAGMDDYLTKPVTLEALDKVIERFLPPAAV